MLKSDNWTNASDFINYHHFQVELRAHDHVVECIAWAPETATAAINEAASSSVDGGTFTGELKKKKSTYLPTNLRNAPSFSRKVTSFWR